MCQRLSPAGLLAKISLTGFLWVRCSLVDVVHLVNVRNLIQLLQCCRELESPGVETRGAFAVAGFNRASVRLVQCRIERVVAANFPFDFGARRAFRRVEHG